MTFESRFAEFVQSNPTLAAPDDARVTLTVKQLKQITRNFWNSGAAAKADEKSIFEIVVGMGVIKDFFR